ncbi:hypothetical protein [Capsulimonas corticalis]|nr:hypothetical protein [Capsulimonas corticalis]
MFRQFLWRKPALIGESRRLSAAALLAVVLPILLTAGCAHNASEAPAPSAPAIPSSAPAAKQAEQSGMADRYAQEGQQAEAAARARSNGN